MKKILKTASGAVAIADIPTKRERSTLPGDVVSAIDLQHPLLKYTTHALSGLGALGGYKLYKKNPALGLVGGMGLGNLVGSNIHSEAERSYALPYMKKISEETNKKYKAAGLMDSQTEYIFDAPINFNEGLKENTPHNIRTTLEYKHPHLNRAPLIGGLIGGLAAYKTKKLLPLGAGLIAGTVGRELAFDHYAQPYKKKFVNEVDKKYNI